MSPVNSSFHSMLPTCFSSTLSVFIGIASNSTRIFLLVPLSVLVLYLGYQRWRQQRSFATTSHLDVFTYHVAVMELIFCLGSAFLYFNLPEMKIAGYFLSGVTFCGEVSFHVLTSVERYLAVVHPVTFLRCREARGVQIRNVIVGWVWLQSFGLSGVFTLLHLTSSGLALLCVLLVSLVLISFCSLIVLCALIRPGPGEVGGDRGRVDQSKQRAFLTIVAILAVLWLWFVGLLASRVVDFLPHLDHDMSCVVKASLTWINLPSSLVLPVLFLHRAGKLACCQR